MGETLNYFDINIIGTHHQGAFNYSIILDVENEIKNCKYEL